MLMRDFLVAMIGALAGGVIVLSFCPVLARERSAATTQEELVISREGDETSLKLSATQEGASIAFLFAGDERMSLRLGDDGAPAIRLHGDQGLIEIKLGDDGNGVFLCGANKKPRIAAALGFGGAAALALIHEDGFPMIKCEVEPAGRAGIEAYDHAGALRVWGGSVPGGFSGFSVYKHDGLWQQDESMDMGFLNGEGRWAWVSRDGAHVWSARRD